MQDGMEFPMTTNTEQAASDDQARPTQSELARYQRAYRVSTRHSEIYPMWQAAMAHAVLLEHDGDRIYADHGHLNGRQLSEGARATARAFALLIAESPARNEEELSHKVAIYEMMCFLEGELERSRTTYMVELAMHYDGIDLGIQLRKEPIANGPKGVQ